jgi:hypothetical protein
MTGMRARAGECEGDPRASAEEIAARLSLLEEVAHEFASASSNYRATLQVVAPE